MCVCSLAVQQNGLALSFASDDERQPVLLHCQLYKLLTGFPSLALPHFSYSVYPKFYPNFFQTHA